MEAIFVDVGHGTCVVLRFGDDDVWLYDCGRLGNDTYSSRGIDSVLWSLGVTRLNGVFLSHADADHFNALPGVLRQIQCRGDLHASRVVQRSTARFGIGSQAVQSHRVEVIELRNGSAVGCEGHTMRVLHPPLERVPGTDNANSLVLRIDGGARALILPGDLEPPGTELLIRHDRPAPGGVLMAPHHGSLRMDAATVLQWSRPAVTIVSGGRRAGRPEVHRMLAETGSSVHVTDQVGAIRVQIDKDGRVEVRSWKQTPW